eukprot:COSAG02_NODE_801_length_17030_cov_150.308428_9_plen_241_part_00
MAYLPGHGKLPYSFGVRLEICMLCSRRDYRSSVGQGKQCFRRDEQFFPIREAAGVSVQILRKMMTQPGAGSAGMPSTHALNVFYIASYLSTGWLWKCATTIQQVADKDGNSAHGAVSHLSPVLAVAAVAEILFLTLASATTILVSGAVAYRRSQIGQHSTKEVTCGIAFGACCGMSWKLTAGNAELCLKPLSVWMFSNGFHTDMVTVRARRVLLWLCALVARKLFSAVGLTAQCLLPAVA